MEEPRHVSRHLEEAELAHPICACDEYDTVTAQYSESVDPICACDEYDTVTTQYSRHSTVDVTAALDFFR